MFRKKVTPPIGRQRPARASGTRPASFSYYARRSDQQLNTGREIARNETAARARSAGRYWRQRFGLGILLLSSFMCLIYISTLSPRPRVVVRDSAYSQAVLQDHTVYEQAVGSILTSSLWNRNKITISTTDLSERLLRQFPELASAEVALPLLNHRPVVYIRAAEPELLLSSGNDAYAIDGHGTALLTGASLSGLSDLQLPLITDQSGLKVQLRKQALTSANVSFIRTVLDQLRARNLPIEGATLPAATNELDIRLQGQPYFIKFNLASNTARQQAGTFLAVYDNLADKGITPTEYVDVRVDGRAYYK